jgi:hypothetical protein
MILKLLFALFLFFISAGILSAQSEKSLENSAELSSFQTALTEETSQNNPALRQPGETGFLRSLTRGTITFNNRFRTETVQQSGFDNARAITNRLQLGYDTRPFNGFSAYVDFVDVRPIGPERYNAAGLNNQPERALVPDPRLTVLNQLYGQFRTDEADILVRVGRQRIIHHSARFVGNVGWRQNEQTFDAITLNTSFGIDNLKAEYNYIWQVNRVLGPDHPLGIFTSDSHLAHLTYDNLIPGSRLTAFLYALDFDEIPSLSTTTYGFRLNGSVDVSDDVSVRYSGSFAVQEEAGDNPFSFSNNYYLIDLGAEKQNRGEIGAAIEHLGGDNIASFETLLATLHAFQGWADQFLSTPPGGLDDFHIYATARLPRELTANVKYHWFYRNQTSEFLGREFNASLGKRVNENLSFLVKFADFGSSSIRPDTRKFWFQMEVQF